MDRYSGHLLYKNIGKPGQLKLSKSSICIVGVGALGSVAAECLARSGIGKLTIIDRDYVEPSNLQRQILYGEPDIGKAKAQAATERLQQINSSIKITSHVADLDSETAGLIGQPDIILGCTDNLDSRFLINDYALKNRIPYVFGSAAEDKGYVYNVMQSPCLRCFLEKSDTETCDTSGILNAVSATIGSLMANEAIKILLAKAPEKDLLYLDLWHNRLERFRVKPRNACPACSGNYEYLGKGLKAQKLCGQGVYQIKGGPVDLGRIVSDMGVARFGSVIHFNSISLFEDGRAIIKAKDMEGARKLYDRYVKGYVKTI